MTLPVVLSLLLLLIEGGDGITSVQRVASTKVGYLASLQTSAGEHVCGGAIVARQFILTAGHCVYGKDVSDYKVSANSGDLRDNENLYEYDIAAFHMHPEFAPATTAPLVNPKNDLAIIQLAKDLILNRDKLYTASIKIAVDPPDYNVRCIFMGWGAMNPDHPEWPTTWATVIRLQVKSSTFCTTPCTVDEGVLYLQDEDSLAAPCNGDDGSPLICHGILAGIASVPHCNPKAITRFSDTAHSLQWINTVRGRH